MLIRPTPGYSGKPLAEKLGLIESMQVYLLNEPENYYQLLGKDIQIQLCKLSQKPDFIHLFAPTEKDFHNGMKMISSFIKGSTIIWVSWYKKSSGTATDLTEDIIRNYALQSGLVDIKVCAVSERWSGLKLVVPLAKRGHYN